MQTLTTPWDRRIDQLAAVGLSATGRIFVEQFMLAQWSGRGINNRQTLMVRLRCATDEQREAAGRIYDEFCQVKRLEK